MSLKIEVTKLSAARRQLETAIELHFTAKDPISAHTLAAAAYGLVQGVNASRGGTIMVKDLWQLLDDPADVDEFRRHINRPDNFLKHADRDPNAQYTLDRQWTEALLVDASRQYYLLTGEYPPLLAVACIWFVVCHPEILSRIRETGIYLPPNLDLSVFSKDRRRFFEEFSPTTYAVGHRR